jgi:hypothetical protein
VEEQWIWMFVVVEINLHVAIQKNVLSSNHTKASRCGVVSAVWLATWLYAAPRKDHRRSSMYGIWVQWIYPEVVV